MIQVGDVVRVLPNYPLECDPDVDDPRQGLWAHYQESSVLHVTNGPDGLPCIITLNLGGIALFYPEELEKV